MVRRQRFFIDTRETGTMARFQDSKLITSEALQEVCEQLLELIQAGHFRITLDFCNLELSSVELVGRLLTVRRAIDRCSGFLTFINVCGSIDELFRVSRLKECFLFGNKIQE